MLRVYSCDYSFFFYCYGDHPDLHSFPTRRSSDLALLKTRGHATLGEIAAHLEISKQAALRHLEVLEGDRKSTRLNSSHMSISYAVFCLKKKKKKPNKPPPHAIHNLTLPTP